MWPRIIVLGPDGVEGGRKGGGDGGGTNSFGMNRYQSVANVLYSKPSK